MNLTLLRIVFSVVTLITAAPLPPESRSHPVDVSILPRKYEGISAYQNEIDAADPIAVLGD